jgi:hypothetical protein
MDTDWSELEERIKKEIKPNSSYILKCDGIGRRRVTSNKNRKIGMQTGSTPNQTKAITYEMVEFAFGMLLSNGRFDSRDFRDQFKAKYKAGPCRFSMTGGVLVELDVAEIVPAENEEACYYFRKL